jgi:ABC-type Fe3+-hydroxamate transport system substrate-binding protein
MQVRDALGREHAFAAPPRRIVSLVPSLSETLFALGAGEALAGVTDFCVHPADGVRSLPRVGGTKNPNLAAIRALRPDLVLANKEENRRRDVEALEASGVPVFVTYARSVREAVDEIGLLGRICGSVEAAAHIAAEVERELALAAAGRAGAPATSTVALVWRDPFMVVGADTFAHDLLLCCGARNPFAGTTGASRYPRVELRALEAAQPEVILLPTEPYAFGERDRDELLRLACPASRAGRVHVIEGELLSWYGPRMPRALETIAALLLPGA